MAVILRVDPWQTNSLFTFCYVSQLHPSWKNKHNQGHIETKGNNPLFVPNHSETLSKWSPHEYLILTKFCNNWVKIVDFIKSIFLGESDFAWNTQYCFLRRDVWWFLSVLSQSSQEKYGYSKLEIGNHFLVAIIATKSSKIFWLINSWRFQN